MASCHLKLPAKNYLHVLSDLPSTASASPDVSSLQRGSGHWSCHSLSWDFVPCCPCDASSVLRLDYREIATHTTVSFQFKGSHFQQLINTRHLPLIFSYSSSFLPQPPAHSEPKLDFSQSSAFYEAVETSLLASTNNSVCSLPHTSSFLVSYTDGSCPNNRTVGPDNPAGWGFALYFSDSYPDSHSSFNDSWIYSYGQVKNSPLDSNIVNPVDGSNNTGEMRAIIELFAYILFYSDLPHGSSVIIYIDSTYVIRSLRGDQFPSTHHQLVELAQQYYTALRTVYYVDLIKVPSHVGIPGNELADSLAKRGVTSSGRVGRFFSRSPLNPPQLGYNSDIWLSKTPQKQSDFLCSLLLSKKTLLPSLPIWSHVGICP